jgi:hypothetical protein
VLLQRRRSISVELGYRCKLFCKMIVKFLCLRVYLVSEGEGITYESSPSPPPSSIGQPCRCVIVELPSTYKLSNGPVVV